MTITLDGRKDEIMKFMAAMYNAGYDGSAKAAPESVEKPKAKRLPGRRRKTNGITDKAMKMIGEKTGTKFVVNAAEMREMLDSKIKEIEYMKDAPLDGCFEHQETNGNKLCAKLDFYEFAKRILRGDAVKKVK